MLCAVFISPAQDAKPSGIVVVDDQAVPALKALCPNVSENVDGRIIRASLDGPFIQVEVAPGRCGRGVTLINIPRGSVRLVSLRGGK